MSATSTVRRFVLDRLYPTALNGLPGLGTPQDLAAEIRATPGSIDDHVDRLVRRHIAISGAAGFASGIGGWLTLPFTLPANLAGVAVVQLHMAASVAALAGHDPAVPAVRERVLGCLVGVRPDDDSRDADQEAMDRVGLKLAERLARLVIATTVETAKWGARQVAAKQVRRKLLRGIPFVGGLIGAASDGYVTLKVAQAAREAFIGGIPEATRDADFPPSVGDGIPDGVVPAPTATRDA